VNQMRFFSSSALASAEKLRLAASCSAAETMDRGSRLRPPRHAGPPRATRNPQDVCGADARHKAGAHLGGLLVLLRLGGENLDRAARLLDRGDRRLRGAVDLEIQLGLDLARAEQPHAVPGATQHARPHQRRRVDHVLGVELARVDRGLDAAEIHLVELLGEDVVEAALGQAAMQRHLAALEALDAHARARRLALAAAAAGLARARADAAPDAVPMLARARPVGEFVELHRSLLVTPPPARGAPPWRSCRAPRACPRAPTPARSC